MAGININDAINERSNVVLGAVTSGLHRLHLQGKDITLKTEAKRSSDMMATTYKTRRRHNRCHHWNMNIKSRIEERDVAGMRRKDFPK